MNKSIIVMLTMQTILIIFQGQRNTSKKTGNNSFMKRIKITKDQ